MPIQFNFSDVYSSWIASTYRVQLDVQSWLNGPHPFVSNCSVPMYSVYNILDKSIAGQTFSTHNDHSKWAMSLSKEQPLVCISDLNRMVSKKPEWMSDYNQWSLRSPTPVLLQHSVRHRHKSVNHWFTWIHNELNYIIGLLSRLRTASYGTRKCN